MKKTVYNIICFIALLSVTQSCRPKSSLPDMRETYSYKDNIPYGGSVAYQMLKNAYPDRNPRIIKEQFADNYQWDYDKTSIYFNLSRNYYLKDRDAEALLSFVYRGNTAFISSEHFDTLLLEKLYCKQEKAKDSGMFFTNTQRRNTTVSFAENLSLYKDSFSYYFYPFDNYFSAINNSYSRKVGTNDYGKTNFFVFFWGKGRLYFHNEPAALSNYFLLTKNNYRYMKEIMQMMPENPENIYWDNFHLNHNYPDGDNDRNFSTLGTILKYPSLAHAFWISLLLLLLYIFFNSKRRQRIIPVVKPVENTSVAFAEAIAGMYLSKKDNRLIAEKAITYFNEHVRTNYFMNVSMHDPAYADMLSRKSGVPLEITQNLTQNILSVSASVKVSDVELLLLNALIEKFFKNKT